MPSAKNKGRVAVVEAYAGKIVSEKTVEGSVEEVVKEVASKLLLEKWLPSLSDFVVLSSSLDVELSLPLNDDEIAFYRKYGLRKVGEGKAAASLPLYLIVYESLKISEDEYHDRGMAAVSVIYRDEELEELKRLLEESTKAPVLREGAAELEELLEEESEEEAEAEEGKQKRKKRKQKV